MYIPIMASFCLRAIVGVYCVVVMPVIKKGKEKKCSVCVYIFALELVALFLDICFCFVFFVFFHLQLKLCFGASKDINNNIFVI